MTLAARALEIATTARESLPDKRKRNREESPDFARWIDDMRTMEGEHGYRVEDLKTGHRWGAGKGAPDASPVSFASIREWVAARVAAMETKGKKRG